MNPIEFSERYLYPYKTNGQEISAMYCPVCHGGEHRDRYTFALNVEKMTFNCKRGSCGIKGTFNQLLKEYGEESFNAEYRIYSLPRKKEYKKPNIKAKVIKEKDQIIQYFESRGISEQTLKARKVCKDEKGNIVFPYFKDGQLVLAKFRTLDKKFWRTVDSEPVFWGLDAITDFETPLTIVEGEIDALTLDECGIKNVVSVPSGSEDLECIENQWEALEKFKRIVIWNDSDTPGIEMRKKLVQRLGEDRCKYIEGKYKDCNEQLQKEGKKSVLESYAMQKETPIDWAKPLDEFEDWDPDKHEFIKSGIKQIDESLGGTALGTVTILSGKNGSGKSTLVNLMIGESAAQGYNTMVFSGETQSQVLRYQIELLYAGDANIVKKHEDGKPTKYYVASNKKEHIREWYKGSIWVYDNIEADCTADAMIKNMKSLYKRHNVKLFVIDNIISMTWNADNEWKMLQEQSNFIKDCIVFARKYNVGVVIVQHPVKKNERISKDDIKGTGDITNRAHGVILVHKMTSEDRKVYAKALNVDPLAVAWNVDIEVAKNRNNGKCPVINTYYEESSRRLKSIGDDFNKKYGWEN
jgi:twinkle protein